MLATITVFYGVTCLSARGVAVSMDVVAPLTVGALFVVIGAVMGKIRPNWFVTLFAYSYFVWRTDPDKVPPAGTLPGNDG